MPVGDYDKTLESSESLSLYEGSRFMRFIKDTIAGFRYGTKNNPKVKGNVISYIDPMGRLITQEQSFTDGANNTKVEKVIRKISTSAKTEAFNSIEVIEKKRNDKGKVIEQTRNFYPSIDDYKDRFEEPKIREITYYQDDDTILRKTIERLLDESEMKKRFDIGAIKLNPLAPDSLKKEIVKSKIIYTVDKQRKEETLNEKLKPFGTHLQINETEKTYILSNTLNPEYDDKILHATGNKSLHLSETKDGKFVASLEKKENCKPIAKAELRGSHITLRFASKNKKEVEKIVPQIAETFKKSWGMNKSTIIECKVKDEEKPFTIKYKDIMPKEEKK